MKVKVLRCMRGPKMALDPGDIYDGDPIEMASWCAHGVAEPVIEKRETPERPAVPKRKRRKAVME
jgi:hypothetical protein